MKLKKNYLILLIITNLTFCIGLLNRYPSDRYQVISPNREKKYIEKSFISKLAVGKTTLKETVDMYGKKYFGNYLTFSPPLKRKYKNEYYKIQNLINYVYVSSETAENQIYTETQINETIHLTLFFDEKGILMFYYVNQNGGKQEYHNLDPSDNDGSVWPGISCDFKYYESVSNPIVGWHLGQYAEANDRSLKCDWEDEIKKF